MKYKIACLDKIHKSGLALLPDAYDKSADQEEADAWLIRSKKLHETVFPKSLELIARAGAGVDNIPLERCAEAGIVVLNTPGANANAVSELVIASMILASRDIVGGINWLRSQEDNEAIALDAEKMKKNFAGSEVRGKSLGIIGLGAIGHIVANTAVGLGMNVYGYDPLIPVEYAWRLSRQVHHVAKLEEMLPRCDYLTIHVPLNDHTEHMIDTAEINLMKKGSILLNFSRDKLCNEYAVLAALESSRLRSYVCDFPNMRNIHFPNSLITPHLGASTLESEENCSLMAVEQMRNYLENGNISHSVNFPDVSLGRLTLPARVVILHRNVPGAIQKMSAFFAAHDYNIEVMHSNSRGRFSAAIFDLAKAPNQGFVESLESYEDIIKVRVLRKE